MTHKFSFTAAEFAAGDARFIPAVQGKTIQLLGVSVAPSPLAVATLTTNRNVLAAYAASADDVDSFVAVSRLDFSSGLPVDALTRFSASPVSINAYDDEMEPTSAVGLPLFFTFSPLVAPFSGTLNIAATYVLI